MLLEPKTSPGNLAELSAPLQAPVEFGRGFLNQHELKLFASGNKRGRELITPTDELSGLPYPIAPSCRDLPLNTPQEADPHHHFHPGNNLFFKTIAGIALRNCRLQLTELAHHNKGSGSYHAYFRGPAFSESPNDALKTCVYACAGYIPSKGIDMASGEPKVVNLSKEQTAWLRTPSAHDEFGYKYLRYSYDPLRRFFTDFALAQDLSRVDKLMLEELLVTKAEARKEHLARCLIAVASRLAVQSMQSDYKEAHKAGLLHPRAQSDPTVLVYFKIRNEPALKNLTPRIEHTAMQALAA